MLRDLYHFSFHLGEDPPRGHKLKSCPPRSQTEKLSPPGSHTRTINEKLRPGHKPKSSRPDLSAPVTRSEKRSFSCRLARRKYSSSSSNTILGVCERDSGSQKVQQPFRRFQAQKRDYLDNYAKMVHSENSSDLERVPGPRSIADAFLECTF